MKIGQCYICGCFVPRNLLRTQTITMKPGHPKPSPRLLADKLYAILAVEAETSREFVCTDCLAEIEINKRVAPKYPLRREVEEPQYLGS